MRASAAFQPCNCSYKLVPKPNKQIRVETTLKKITVNICSLFFIQLQKICVGILPQQNSVKQGYQYFYEAFNPYFNDWPPGNVSTDIPLNHYCVSMYFAKSLQS